MPILDHDMEHHGIAGSHYGFSAAGLDRLGATEYTVVAIAADCSPSVSGFIREIEACVTNVVTACHRSPRADNLLLRVTAFHGGVDEIHGFKPLGECPPDSYPGCLKVGGATALYDAAHNAVLSVTRYGRTLTDHGLTANGIVFVITDGEDNSSSLTAKEVKRAVAEALRGEHLESVLTVLVGVNVRDDRIARYLQALARDAAFSHYVELDAADADTLAGLSDFVSRSIALQSRALASGVRLSF
jgi:uncharacterized protein YegL